MMRIGFSLLTLLTCLSFSAKASLTTVTGTTTDKATGEPLAYVSIGFTGTNTGGLSDDLGHFSLETPEHTDSIRVFMVGYKELRVAVDHGRVQTLNLSLEEQDNTLEEVSILAKNMPMYRNKDNPAVALMRKVIDHKDQNYDKGKTTVAYDEYEKLQVSLLRSLEKIRNEKQNRNALARMFEKGDTTKVNGKASLPIVVHEKVMRHEEDKEQGRTAHNMIDEKRTSLDGIVDDDGLEAYLDKMYVAADIYDNNIILGDQQLLSPVAGLAPEFYKYFITDTITEDGQQKVRLSFYPRNKTDLLFKGELVVALETHAVTEVNLTVNKAINLNWVDDLKIHLLYQKSDNGAYYLQNTYR
ncbi:MAG: carboxypeptidase-like regulatory domain-containing protein [Sphingobacteriales bacterium]|nr:MAG: carboxypeptidase-like regulatory domain-containing protein [Sphingobacteriales bacterium]